VSFDVHVTTFAGLRAAMVMPTIPDDAPTAVREGLARRRIVMTTGTCPCGARLTQPNRAQRRAMQRKADQVWQVDVDHETGCPAIDAVLLEAIRRWKT
jgi:hypothetical protein